MIIISTNTLWKFLVGKVDESSREENWVVESFCWRKTFVRVTECLPNSLLKWFCFFSSLKFVVCLLDHNFIRFVCFCTFFSRTFDQNFLSPPFLPSPLTPRPSTAFSRSQIYSLLSIMFTSKKEKKFSNGNCSVVLRSKIICLQSLSRSLKSSTTHSTKNEVSFSLKGSRDNKSFPMRRIKCFRGSGCWI